MLNLTVTDATDLDQANGEIHDWFFDIEDIAFDRQGAELTIPFRRWSYEEARLIGEDSPDPTRSTLVVTGNVPVMIEVHVHAIAVDIEQTDELLGIARYRTYSGGGDGYTGEVFPLPAGHEWAV